MLSARHGSSGALPALDAALMSQTRAKAHQPQNTEKASGIEPAMRRNADPQEIQTLYPHHRPMTRVPLRARPAGSYGPPLRVEAKHSDNLGLQPLSVNTTAHASLAPAGCRRFIVNGWKRGNQRRSDALRGDLLATRPVWDKTSSPVNGHCKAPGERRTAKVLA